MDHYKFIVLGGGPSGLAFAHALRKLGEHSVLVLEKEQEPGGLCRSAVVDGAPLDIGGGHFLDVRRREVLDLLFEFMPREEWNEYGRLSTINLRGRSIDYPLEANLWQLPIEAQTEFLESIARAGCVRGEPMPREFGAWISWKLGERIAHEYMLPYNRKIWSIDLNRLGTYWLHKLPSVSFTETLQSCLQGRRLGSLPAHGVFLYPKKHGYGEVWRRMGEALGASLLLGTPVVHIDLGRRRINGMFTAEHIISTIPWTLWPRFSDLPGEICQDIGQLFFTSIDIDYCSTELATNAHWVYEPDESISYHRILCRHNFLPGARGYWTETNSERSSKNSRTHHNEFAYPLNTIDKPDVVARIQKWAQSQGIRGLGRWGVWEHMNSDVAVSEAIDLAREFVYGPAKVKRG